MRRRKKWFRFLVNNKDLILVAIVLMFFILLSGPYINQALAYPLVIILILLSSISLFFKIKNVSFFKWLTVSVVIFVPTFYFLLKVSDGKASLFLSFIAWILAFIGLVLILNFIIFSIYKTIRSKKYQLAFNIVVAFALILFAWLLFGEKNDSGKRLARLERRLGGTEKVRCNENDTIKKIKPSVVRVVGGVGEGSGFVFTDYGFVLTNFHVIQFEPAPKVMFSDNTFEPAEIVYTDKNYDLAILMIDKKVPALIWGDSDELEPAEEILAVGYPFGGTLVGEATVKKGGYSGRRVNKENGLIFIQTDMTLNPGMSGGPIINVCGEVVGINTSGTVGLGLAISSKSFKEKRPEIFASKDPLKDVKRIEFNPNRSPLDAVEAFYNYIKIRKLDKAYALLSDNFLKGGSFESWKKGYVPNLDTSVIKIEDDPEKENVVNVKLSTKDLVGDEIVYKYFEGWWEVKEIDENLKLWQPKIKEVKDPDWFWFYE